MGWCYLYWGGFSFWKWCKVQLNLTYVVIENKFLSSERIFHFFNDVFRRQAKYCEWIFYANRIFFVFFFGKDGKWVVNFGKQSYIWCKFLEENCIHVPILSLNYENWIFRLKNGKFELFNGSNGGHLQYIWVLFQEKWMLNCSSSSIRRIWIFEKLLKQATFKL